MLKSKQKGFSMIELMVVLVIGAILISAIMQRTSRAETAQLKQRFVDDVALIASQAKGWKGTKSAYTGISMTTMTGMALLDTTWGAGTGVNPVGGNYTVTVNGTDSAAINVTATGMENSLCLQVENAIEPSTKGGNTAACAGGTLTATFK